MPEVDQVAERRRRAVAVVFALNGLAFAAWASRTPAIKDALGLDASGLGLLLMCLSIGSVISLPLSGPLVDRIGGARGVLGGALLQGSGFLVVASALAMGTTWVTALGLFVAGVGDSVWDVSMNVQGADAERRLGRSIMARFHAAWSLGTMVGAALGTAAAAAGVSAPLQIAAVAVPVLIIGPLASSRFPSYDDTTPEQPRGRSRASMLGAWRTPRTLVIGIMVLAFAFSEGVANSWTAVVITDGLGGTETAGAIGFSFFVAAMTASRTFGVQLVDRYGRVVLLRASAVIAAGGVTLVMFGPGLPWVLTGALAWGGGTALGFPTGMSAAADNTDHAALHVSVVSSIAYIAFLAGPPLVGFLADAIGIRESLFLVLIGLVVGGVAAASARPLEAEVVDDETV